ncbi:MAG: non-heme chloroperoxidase [Paracoccaceae bacterium]|jgi:non-heme chloroperoxidase
MRQHWLKGGNDTMIFVTDQGALDAPALLFIHGWAQSHICWREQNTLVKDYRLVSVDLRGHGVSDKPHDMAAYTDTALWGEDINAIVQELSLDHPILIGWSYCSRVVASYLDTYGDTGISGVVLVGGILAIGDARQDWMVGPTSPAMNADLYSQDDARRLAATKEFVSGCTVDPLPSDQMDELIAVNMACPAFVRRALFAASWDFQPVYKNLRKPALVIHGKEDRVVEARSGITAAEIIPNARLALYENTGHAPFLEQPERFNADIAEFAATAFGAPT